MAHAIKALLSHYDAAFQKRFGVKAPIVGSKDAALAKRLLALYSQEDLDRWLDRFFEMTDPFICGSGYTFGVFSACIGKVIASMPKPKPIRNVEPQEIKIAQQIRAHQMASAKELVDEYYRTHPWVTKP